MIPLILVIVPLIALPSDAQETRGSPELRAINPPGGTLGKTVEITLTGERLQNPRSIHFFTDSITVESITARDDKTVDATLAISPQCALGEHPLRLRTDAGWTELRTFFVGAFPAMEEVEPNEEFKSAQVIPLNTTMLGVMKDEDADVYAVAQKAGQRLSVEIEAMRLGRVLFDPAVAILDANRFELATSDDSPLLGQDSFASVIVPADGTYYVCVREASYGGSDRSKYRLHVGDFPRPASAWPPAAKPGEHVEISLRGDPRGTISASIDVPLNAKEFVPVFATDGERTSPSPNLLRVSALSTFREPAPDAPPELPLAFEGAVAAPGEQDVFRFQAKGGQALDIRLLARRLRTPLDAVLEVLDANGGVLAGNDDAAGADPELRWTPPSDGVFQVRVRDHRLRGGENFIYRIEIETPRPSLRAELERVDARRPQLRQSISVPRGNRAAVMMRAERQNVGGEAQLAMPTLPQGVTLSTVPMPADLPAAPMIFEAAPDAPLDGGLYPVDVSIGDLRAGFVQTMPLVLGPPNDTVYYQTRVDRLAVAVSEAAPFSVHLVPPAAPLLRQGARQLQVQVNRIAGFTGEVIVQMLWNPPGISSASSITVPGDASSATYPINAAGDAPIKTWPIAVVAHAQVGGGELWASSGLVNLAVADVFATGSIQMATTQVGQPAQLVVKIDPVRAYEGIISLTLQGLPPKTAAKAREISGTDREVVFEITTEGDAPVGQHKGLFCDLTATVGEERLIQRLASDGTLRIDAPRPKEQAGAAPAATAPAPEQKAAPPKPLSRLEQLRKKQSSGEPP